MSLCILAAAVLSISHASHGVADLKKKVLIIGLDGVRPDALLVAKAPNLLRLIEEGAFSDKAQTGEVPVSGPGWSSLLTGVWMEKHGVRDNSFNNKKYDRYPHFFKRVKEAMPDAMTASISEWSPINEQILSHSDYASTPGGGEEVAKAVVELLVLQDPDAIFVHLDGADGAGHEYGYHPTIPEYVKSIEDVDVLVGRILDAVRGRPTYEQEDWLIIVSTDHGGKGTGHSANDPEIRTIFIIAHGPSVINGAIEPAPNIVDVAVTALAHLGIEAKPEWELDGKVVGIG
ncbi:MAG: alkaline phosphatase family protein [Armatimonadetes bacterium]|nr:alkaline phosphatase family protein [Armatimonadota bacterium]